MKKKIVSLFIASTVLGALFIGCGKQSTETATEETVSEESEEEMAEATEEASTEAIEDAASEEVSEEDAELPDYETFSVLTDVLPDYEYPGPEAFYEELYDYLEDLNESYDEADVTIPCVRILDIDESDKSDIKVYGDFGIYNYNLSGDTLACASGGDYPGVIHITTEADGDYEVTKFDQVEDGSNFDSSAKKLFGDKYDEFIALDSDDEDRNAVRAQIIANYVAANNLDVKYYQDYGWDKVELPEENIDSFYSDLD